MKNLFLILVSITLIQCVPATSSEGDDSAALVLLLLDESPTRNRNSQDMALDRVTTETVTGGNETTVNASSTRFWVYVDLKAGGVQVTETGSWDMRFRRFLIGTNSGASGSGQGGACDTGSTDFPSISSASTCTFQVDSIQTQSDTGGNADVNDPASPALFEWYSYNETILTAKNNVYIIRGSDGSTRFKLQMRGYYSSAGTSGYPKFLWARL
ncbi:MAG: HmuY family protein [Leptospira sp.]|nr:HmuY family protein [Leptospira sp.]